MGWRCGEIGHLEAVHTFSINYQIGWELRNIPCRCSLVFSSRATLHLDGNLNGVAESHADNLIDSLADTGTEQARSSLLRKMAQDFLEILLETEIKQSIGLIQNKHFKG